MKYDQCAYYCSTKEQADQIKDQFGLADKEWIHDTVTARSVVCGRPEEENVAELQFNYSLSIELEIIRYVKGNNWHSWCNPLLTDYKDMPFFSHAGLHLDDGEAFPRMQHCRLVQETFTLSHTADYLTNPRSPACGRKYHYRIHELSPGSYIKFIKRVHP